MQLQIPEYLPEADGRMPGARQPFSLLIIEEDRQLRALLALLAGAAGFRVYTARDEVEGLRQFRRVLPDAVVGDADNGLPGGDRLWATIRSEEPGEPIPLVILTSGRPEDRRADLPGLWPVFAVDKSSGVRALIDTLTRLRPAGGPARGVQTEAPTRPGCDP
jgi:CheY-like chemotaxis protein